MNESEETVYGEENADTSTSDKEELVILLLETVQKTVPPAFGTVTNVPYTVTMVAFAVTTMLSPLMDTRYDDKSAVGRRVGDKVVGNSVGLTLGNGVADRDVVGAAVGCCDSTGDCELANADGDGEFSVEGTIDGIMEGINDADEGASEVSFDIAVGVTEGIAVGTADGGNDGKLVVDAEGIDERVTEGNADGDSPEGVIVEGIADTTLVGDTEPGASDGDTDGAYVNVVEEELGGTDDVVAEGKADSCTEGVAEGAFDW